jgi:hypothetical protein
VLVPYQGTGPTTEVTPTLAGQLPITPERHAKTVSYQQKRDKLSGIGSRTLSLSFTAAASTSRSSLATVTSPLRCGPKTDSPTSLPFTRS